MDIFFLAMMSLRNAFKFEIEKKMTQIIAPRLTTLIARDTTEKKLMNNETLFYRYYGRQPLKIKLNIQNQY